MEIINALLDAGADPNVEMNFHRPNAPNRGRFGDNHVSTGTTALFRAVQLNDVEVVEALLKKGADPNVNSMGYTAFLLAAGAGPGGRGGGSPANMAMLDLMTEHSADVNAKVTGTQTWSYNVSRPASSQPIDDVGRCSADNEGMSALHTAAQSSNTNLVRYLLEKGADPNLLNGEGKKPVDLVGTRARVSQGVGCGGPAAAVQGKGNAKGGPGGAKGGPGGGGATPANLAEIRSLLEAASAKQLP